MKKSIELLSNREVKVKNLSTIYSLDNIQKAIEDTVSNIRNSIPGIRNPGDVFACTPDDAASAAICSLVSSQQQETLRLAAQSSASWPLHNQFHGA